MSLQVEDALVDLTSEKRRSPTRTRLWGTLLAPPAIWMVLFFISSVTIVVLLSFGHVNNVGKPVFGFSLDNYKALADPVYRAKFITAQSLEPGGMSRAEFSALLRSEEVRWGQLVRESGAKIE